jgi:hypothetical protein
MSGIAVAHDIQIATQAATGIFGVLAARFAWKMWRDDAKLDRFGRWHATPLARVCDACTWCLRQLMRRPGRCPNAIVHFLLTAAFPVAAVLVSNFTAVKDQPIWFGLAGIVASVLAEAPETYARDAQYRQQGPPTADSIQVDTHLKGLARFKKLHPDQKVAAIAVPVALLELLLGGGLYYGVYKTHFLGHVLNAVALGVALVAWAEAMSVISTMWLVKRNGSPFVNP